jgi:hypothetical protein
VIDPRFIWLRNEILERFRTAKAVKAARWHVNHRDEANDVDDDQQHVVATVGDIDAAAHIAMNDPESVIGNCLAELKILAEHRSSGAFVSFATTKDHCTVCNTDYPCNTIRTLHSGYRNRAGWTAW